MMVKEDNIEWEYDFDGDSMFINDIKDYKYKESIEITDDIILDIDENNEVVALEILDASKIFGIEKKFIRHLVKIEINIMSNEENIFIKAAFNFMIHQRSTPKELNEKIVNDINLPIHDTHLVSALTAK
ncbi:MAG: DUF2283 domain-containing protein [Methanobacterium sp.]|jgi:uncharacterized protein YuzE